MGSKISVPSRIINPIMYLRVGFLSFSCFTLWSLTPASWYHFSNKLLVHKLWSQANLSFLQKHKVNQAWSWKPHLGMVSGPQFTNQMTVSVPLCWNKLQVTERWFRTSPQKCVCERWIHLTAELRLKQMPNRVSEQNKNILCPDIMRIINPIKLGKKKEKEMGAIISILIASSVIV